MDSENRDSTKGTSFMFSRGNWAIIGIAPETYPEFEKGLNDASLMLAYSQLAASAVARLSSVPSMGLNPFDRPRLDQDMETNPSALLAMVTYVGTRHEDRSDSIIDEFHLDDYFRYGIEGFRVQGGARRFGFWFVTNEATDVGDMKSIKEDMAYTATHKPYKFLSSAEKKAIETDARATTAQSRKQFAVLIDFESARMFVEATSKATLLLVRHQFDLLGLKTHSVAWSFGEGEWLPRFLGRLYDESKFRDQFLKRAEESTRFDRQETQIERLDTPEMERVMSDYFSMTELETEEWIGIGAPAQIRLSPGANSVVATAPTTATLLLGTTEAAHLAGAALSIQERRTVTTKTGEERIYRDTIYTIDVGSNMNEAESGAALLRGFDLPSFKRSIQREVRKSKEAPPISRYWSDWLIGLNQAAESFVTAVRSVLDLDRSQAGGLVVSGEPAAGSESDVIEGGWE